MLPGDGYADNAEDKLRVSAFLEESRRVGGEVGKKLPLSHR